MKDIYTSIQGYDHINDSLCLNWLSPCQLHGELDIVINHILVNVFLGKSEFVGMWVVCITEIEVLFHELIDAEMHRSLLLHLR